MGGQSNAKRHLTAGETALIKAHFPRDKPSLDRVRLCDGHGNHPFAMAAFKNGNTAITLRNTVYFGPNKYCADYSLPEEKGRRELFMHEMTHVWQWHRLGVAGFGLRYGRDFARSGGKARAMYGYKVGMDRFADAMLEAQAQMVGDYMEALVWGNEARNALIARNLAGSGFYSL